MKITEVSPQKNNPQRVNVYADGDYVFSLDEVDALVMGIKPGREITDQDLKNCLFESQFSKAKSKAMEILSRKPLSKQMLADELQKKEYDEVVIAEVINEFESLGYLDDYNYAMLYIEYAASKIWGEKKIRYELNGKGIDPNTIEDAICASQLPGTEEIAELIKQKYSGEDTDDIKVKQRIFRFFASRGFDFSLVEKALKLIKD